MDDLFHEAPSDTREEILHAAFVVLQEHGYAGLSIKRIADEVGLQKASVYHHYSNKDDLLFCFLEFVLDRVEEKIVQSSELEPLEQLYMFIDHILVGEKVSIASTEHEPPSDEAIGAFVQVRAQAVHDAEFRERITTVDQTHHNQLVSIIERGIEEGNLRDVDPDPIAATLLTLLVGGFSRRVTTNDPDLEQVRDRAVEYIEQTLCE